MKSLNYILAVALLYSITFNYVCRAENNYVKDIALIKDDLSGTTELINNYIIDLGYTADILNSQYVTHEILNRYRLTILSAGNNQYACVSAELRSALQSYMSISNGKIIIEGGHLGYIAAVFPFYLAFRQKVMKIDGWIADNGGNLEIGKNNFQYNLPNIPNKLPSTIKINMSNIFDQDICTNDNSSQIFYKTSLYSDKVGILVAPDMDNPRVINYFVNFASIANQDEAKDLLENSIYNLIGKPVGIGSNGSDIPGGYSLEQNYPNPFNPVTKIVFALPKSGNISLKVFDSLGRVVKTLADELRSAGTYEEYFDASSLTSGVYSYKLIAGSVTITRKMILIK
ncbi:MAG: T9SS type A sorting domain-containing protein [bacterium]